MTRRHLRARGRAPGRASSAQPVIIVSALVVALAAALGACHSLPPAASPRVLDLEAMSRIGTVDQRYQSYNVEMLEVTGGRFWKPYSQRSGAVAPAVADSVRGEAASRPLGSATSARSPVTAGGVSGDGGTSPAGMDPNLYQYRPPLDLSNPRLRKLAAALGPAYVRVSGTWANTTWLADVDPAPTSPPAGFDGVLTHAQWKGVVDFAHAVDARIVTSFANSPGTRDTGALDARSGWATSRPYTEFESGATLPRPNS